MTITAPSITATAPSRHRHMVTDLRRAELVADADRTVSTAGRELMRAVIARLDLTPTLAGKCAAIAAQMFRGAVALFKASTGALKILLALVLVAMVGDLVAYPAATLGALNEGSRATFGMDFFQVLSVIPTPVIVGYAFVVAAGIVATIGITRLARRATTRGKE